MFVSAYVFTARMQTVRCVRRWYSRYQQLPVSVDTSLSPQSMSELNRRAAAAAEAVAAERRRSGGGAADPHFLRGMSGLLGSRHGVKEFPTVEFMKSTVVISLFSHCGKLAYPYEAGKPRHRLHPCNLGASSYSSLSTRAALKKCS